MFTKEQVVVMMEMLDIVRNNQPANQQQSKSFMEVGKAYMVRCVTYHYTGRVTRVSADEVELEEAAWIAVSGRWNEFLTTGIPTEVEPYEDPIVLNRAVIVDYTLFPHALPREVL